MTRSITKCKWSVILGITRDQHEVSSDISSNAKKKRVFDFSEFSKCRVTHSPPRNIPQRDKPGSTSNFSFSDLHHFPHQESLLDLSPAPGEEGSCETEVKDGKLQGAGELDSAVKDESFA